MGKIVSTIWMISGKNVLDGQCVMCETLMFIVFTFVTFFLSVLSLAVGGLSETDLINKDNDGIKIGIYFLEFLTRSSGERWGLVYTY